MAIAYGKRDDIQVAISESTIPPGTIIITNDNNDNEEMFFYDTNNTLKQIHERQKFLTFDSAKKWAEKYNCVGAIFSIQNGSSWMLYVVQSDNTLSPVGGGSIIEDITNIDGGNAFGIN